ncbi:hypothetical protein ACHAXS_004387 [Conticribra weissflogii]
MHRHKRLSVDRVGKSTQLGAAICIARCPRKIASVIQIKIPSLSGCETGFPLRQQSLFQKRCSLRIQQSPATECNTFTAVCKA